jgi:alpha-1,3-rhamnosyl/mannosyltransferase
MWNRLNWPPVEWLAGDADVVHAQSPLLIPARAAAQVITIHDLDFLSRPDRARAEMRRDYPALARTHAHRADHIVVSSHYAAGEVVRHLGVVPARVSVCSPGAPAWAREIAARRAYAIDPGSTILFVGTIDARKNVGGLLDAYERLKMRTPDAPPLVIAGRLTDAAAPLIDRVKSGTLANSVSFRGYVADHERPLLYQQARMVVLPSFEEGFGLPVLEAMACGVPVIVSNRGSLPEVAGDAAQPIDPDDVDGFAAQMKAMLDREAAVTAIARGRAQASRYTWEACATAALEVYRQAIAHRAGRAA